MRNKVILSSKHIFTHDVFLKKQEVLVIWGILIIVIADMFLTWADLSVRAEDERRIFSEGSSWYVSPNGTDLGNGSILNPWDLQTALNGGNGSIMPGDTVWLRNGTYSPGNGNDTFWFVTFSGEAVNLVTWRSFPGEWAKIDRPWRFGADTYHRFRDLEFFDSQKGKFTYPGYPNGPWLHFDGSSPNPAGNEWINCVLHDVTNLWGGCTDGALVRGNIIWYVGNANGYEHTTYPLVADFEDNIVLWASGDSINLIGDNLANNETMIKSNVFYGTGLAGGTSGTDIRIGGTDNHTSIITYNYFFNGYNSETDLPDGIPSAFFLNGLGNDHINISNNIIVSYVPIYMPGEDFATVVLENNTFFMNYGSAHYPVLERHNPGINWTVNYNHYYAHEPYSVNFEDTDSGRITFQQWKVRNPTYDVNSTSNDSSSPPDAVYLIPNKDEEGRATIVIYNWANKSNIIFDVSGILSNGDNYSLYSAQNYLAGPVQSGNISGTAINITMTNLTAAPILYGGNISGAPIVYGSGMLQPSPTTPEFGVFVLQKIDSLPGEEEQQQNPTVNTRSPGGGGGSGGGAVPAKNITNTTLTNQTDYSAMNSTNVGDGGKLGNEENQSTRNDSTEQTISKKSGNYGGIVFIVVIVIIILGIIIIAVKIFSVINRGAKMQRILSKNTARQLA